jgi:protein-S-isoprenylcysteine O-methyltransferase Ste14
VRPKLGFMDYATLAIAAFALGFLFWINRALPLTPLRMAGLALGLPSLVLLAVARLQAGSLLCNPDQLLRTAGLYSRLRFPLHLFSCLAALGLFVWVGTDWRLALPPLALVFGFTIYDVRKQDKALTERYGREYQEYRRHTWF